MYKLKKILLNIGVKICSLFKIKNIIILESLPTLTDNAKVLYDYLIKNGYNNKYKILWFADQRCKDVIEVNNVKIIKIWKVSRKFSLVGFFKYIYYVKNAKYIIECNRHINKINNKTIIIYLGHGLALKKVSDLNIVSPTVNYVITPSKFFSEVYLEQLHLSNERILNLGLPRTDKMFNYKKKKIKFDFIDTNIKKIILWLPTFRENSFSERVDSTKDYPLGIPIIYDMDSLKEVNEYLKERSILLLLKPHPVQDLNKIKVMDLSNFKIICDDDIKRNNITLQELYFYMDGVLTDYSSVYYDALIADNHIGFTIDDFEEYKNTRGFPFDKPLEKMVGNKIYNMSDFYKYIDEVDKGIDNYRGERKKILNLFYQDHDGKSCERLVKYLNL